MSTKSIAIDPNPDKTKAQANILIRIINSKPDVSKPDVMVALNETIAVLFDNYDENKFLIQELLSFKYDLMGM